METSHIINDVSSVSILYVEDEATIRTSILKILKRRFENCYVATNGQEGLELYNQHNPDIIITDIQMPVMNGLDMIKTIRQNDLKCQIIITSAYNNSEFLFEAIQAKVDAFILKPINTQELLARIKHCAKEVQFRLLEQMFQFVAQQILQGLLLVDEKGKIYYANDAFATLSGFDISEIIGSSFVDDKETLSPFMVNSCDWEKLLHKEKIADVVLKKRKSGKNYYQKRTIFPLTNTNGKITNLVFMSEDVTKMQLEINTLKEEAEHDTLTGLFRRIVFEHNIENIMMQNKGFILAMIDIDFFKSINDEFGHDVGDNVLKQFTYIIASRLRNDDTCFRWGGEEFLLLLHTNNIEDAFVIVERIRHAIAQADFQINRPVTASIGLAAYNGVEDWEQTLKRTDKALYKAKNSGRNQTCKDID